MNRRNGFRSPWGSLALCLGAGLLLAAAPTAGAADEDEPKDEPRRPMVKYDTPYYELHTDMEIDRVREAYARMTTMAETYYERTKGFAGRIRSRMPFYMFCRSEDYLAAGGLPGSAGVFTNDRLMAIADAKHRNSVWGTLQHEGFHQFAFYMISRNLPVWVNEGLAEYFGEALWTGDGYVTGVVPRIRLLRIKAMITTKSLMPFRDMLAMTIEEWNAKLALRNYDQGWSMVHFLAHGDGGKYLKAFGQYISDVARGGDPYRSWPRLFGTDSTEFEKAYADWWSSQPANPSADLYTEAAFRTMLSFLARTKAAGVEAETADDLVRLVRDGNVVVDGAKYPRLWLPASLGARVARRADALGRWSLDTKTSKAKLILEQPDGTVFTGTCTPGNSRALPKLNVDIRKPDPPKDAAKDKDKDTARSG